MPWFTRRAQPASGPRTPAERIPSGAAWRGRSRPHKPCEPSKGGVMTKSSAQLTAGSPKITRSCVRIPRCGPRATQQARNREAARPTKSPAPQRTCRAEAYWCRATSSFPGSCRGSWRPATSQLRGGELVRLVVVVGRHWPLLSNVGRPGDGPASARSTDSRHPRCAQSEPQPTTVSHDGGRVDRSGAPMPRRTPNRDDDA